MIGTSLLAFFVLVSAIPAGIAAYVSKQLIYSNQQLANPDILLLTMIFGAVGSIVFVTIFPVPMRDSEHK